MDVIARALALSASQNAGGSGAEEFECSNASWEDIVAAYRAGKDLIYTLYIPVIFVAAKVTLHYPVVTEGFNSVAAVSFFGMGTNLNNDPVIVVLNITSTTGYPTPMWAALTTGELEPIPFD